MHSNISKQLHTVAFGSAIPRYHQQRLVGRRPADAIPCASTSWVNVSRQERTTGARSADAPPQRAPLALTQCPSIATTQPWGPSSPRQFWNASAGSRSVHRRCLATIASKVPGGNSGVTASPNSNLTCTPRRLASRRASPSIASERSVPTTRCPSSAAISATNPVPVPTSRTSAGVDGSRERSASTQALYSLLPRAATLPWCASYPAAIVFQNPVIRFCVDSS